MSGFYSLLSSQVGGFLPIAVDAAGKSFVLLALAGVATLIMRRSSAAARHWVWTLGMASLLFLPALSTALPGWRVLPSWAQPAWKTLDVPDRPEVRPVFAEPPESPAAAAASNEATRAPLLQSAAASTPGPVAAEPAHAAAAGNVEPVAELDSVHAARTAAPVAKSHGTASSRFTGADLVLSTWLVGICLMLGRLAMAALCLKRVERRSRRIEDQAAEGLIRRLAGELGLRREIGLLQSDDRTMPMAWGIWRTRLLLPAESSSWSAQRLRMVLLHELAHVRRGDALAGLLAQLARAVYWFNPLAWAAVRRMAAERERACDDLVLGMGSAPADYAQELLHVAVGLRGRRLLAGAALAMARPCTLEGRLLAILDPQRNRRRLTRAGALFTASLMIAVAIPVALMRPATRAEKAKSVARSPENSPAQPAGSTGRITISGVVVDAYGNPAVDADLASESVEGFWAYVSSDKQGRFTLNDVQPGSEWTAVSVHLRKIGFFKAPPQPTTEPLVAKLEFDHVRLEGRLTDRAGRALGGQQVEWRVLRPDGTTLCSRRMKTENDGYYEESRLPVGEGFAVEIRTARPAGGKGGWTHRRALSTNEVAVEMPDLIDTDAATEESTAPTPARPLYSGRVLDENRQPIEGALVELNWSFARGDLAYSDRRETMTDAEGRWRRHLPADAKNFRIELFHRDYISTKFERGSHITPSKEHLLDGSAVMVMRRGHSVSGRVEDENGKPVPRALILTQDLISRSPGPVSQPIEDWTMTRTDEHGCFRTCALPAGRRNLVVYASGSAPRSERAEVVPEMRPVVIRLEQGDTIRGQVVDTTGKPVKGAFVYANEWNTVGEHSTTVWDKTDENGSFLLEHLPPQGTYKISYYARRSEYINGRVDKPAGPFTEPLKLVLKSKDDLVVRGRVVNDATGEPLTEFDLTTGRAYSDGDLTFWGHGARHVNSSDGSFEQKLDGSGAVRISARGYVPQASPVIEPGPKAETFTIRLKRGEPIRGTVLSPEGKPIQGAKVAWIGPKRLVRVIDGRIDNDALVAQADTIVKTDAQGRFELPAFEEPALIFVVHESGYAIRPSTEQRGGSSISITGWARIEGVVKSGEEPVHEATVLIDVPEPDRKSQAPRIIWSFGQTTHTDGTFAFSHVPCLPLTVGRRALLSLSHPVRLTPEAGRTYRIEIGAGGRTVASRIEEPEGMTIDRFRSEFALGVTSTFVAAQPISPYGQADAETNYAAELEEDGRFQITGLPPGKYELTARIHPPPQPNTCGLPMAIASANVRFDVPNEKSGGVIELPPIELTVQKFPKAGDPAPAIQAKTLTGERFTLQELRGKYVVLDFWATWCGPCMGELPQISKLAAKYASAADSVAFIGLNLDHNEKNAKEAIQRSKLGWTQVSGGIWTPENPIMRAYGLTAIPSLWLIGPDGRVLASGLTDTADLETALEAAVKQTQN